MDETLRSLLVGLLSGAISAAVTYFATLAKARLDLSVEYDRQLRQNRLDAYQDLWKRLKPLAPFSPERPATHEIVRETSESMRDWYFDVGGIYLSQEAREPYFALKRVMQAIIDHPALQQARGAALGDEWLGPLHERATALRTALSNDIGSRKRAFV